MTPSRQGAPGSAEAEACQRAAYFEALFYSLDIGLCLLDASLQVVAVNPAMERLWGASHFDAGNPCPGPREAGQGRAGPCPAAEALASGKRVGRLVEESRPGGGHRFLSIECHPVVDTAGETLGVAAIAYDVTRREEAERGVALAVQDIEMLLDSIRSILVSLDGDDRVRRFNVAAEKAFGLSGEAVAGRNFFSVGLAWDGEAVREAVETSRASLQPVRVDEVRCRMPDGTERLLGLTVNPVPVPQGERAGVLLLGQDLTDIKAREFKNVHERRMQSIGRLAAGIAHEINTPIQYVGYNAGFLDEAFADLLDLLDAHERLADMVEAGGEPALAEAVRAVRERAAAVDLAYLRQEVPAAIANSRKGIKQVTDIVRAMRQLSHPGSGDMIFLDLNAAVRDAVTVSRNAWKQVATVEEDLAPDLPLVYGLPQEVAQVLLNVLLNAAQAVEERVGREPWFRGRIVVRTRVTGDHVVVAISDDGPGIDESVRARIFDPFFTTKAVGKGTGQGLAISHAVMVRHGGAIDFICPPGEGTTFSLRFPTEGERRGGG